MLQLLQQSLDQIDEPREIEIGRQLAAVLLGSKEAGSKHGLKPRAKIRAFANIGSEPAMMLTGPVDVTAACAGGKVTGVTIVRGHPLFDAVVLSTVRGWRYRPALADGKPVSVSKTVPIRFSIKT